VKTFLVVAAVLLASASTFAGGQHVIADYATGQRNFFWTKLYVNGGRDLYYNVRSLSANALPSSMSMPLIGLQRISAARIAINAHTLIMGELKPIFTTCGLQSALSTLAVATSCLEKFPGEAELTAERG
jgi:hypothetical protein